MSEGEWDVASGGDAIHIDPGKTTVEDFERLCSVAMDLKANIKTREAEVSELNRMFRDVEAKIILHFNALDKDKHASSQGTISLQRRITYKVPKEPHLKEAFMGYLKQKGVYESLVTVHSQTLNAFAKEELEAAKLRSDYKFEIPGLGEPTVSEGIRVTPKRR